MTVINKYSYTWIQDRVKHKKTNKYNHLFQTTDDGILHLG